jgi:hypothetical protein
MTTHSQILSHFQSLLTSENSIAMKISKDIEEIQSSYEKLWLKMEDSERENIIDEMIIKPEISLRYFDNFSSSSESEDNDQNVKHNKKKVPTAKKCKNGYLFDGKNLHTYCMLKTDTNCWDEHSAPFLMKTKSQINMNNLFHEKPITLPTIVIKSQHKSSPMAKSIKKVIDDEAHETKVLLANILNSSVGYINQHTPQNITRKSLPPPPLPPTIASSPSLEDEYNSHENEGEDVLLKQSSKTMMTTKTNVDHSFFFTKLNSQNNDELVSDVVKIKYSNISPQSSSASSLGNSSTLLGAIVNSELGGNSTKIDSELETLLSGTEGFDFLNNW